MQDPNVVTDVNGEWFEIYNMTGDHLNLNGLTVSDNGTDSFTIAETLVIQASDYLVLGKNDDMTANGSLLIQYEYGSQMTLSNADDEIILSNDGGMIDMVAWDDGQTFPDPTGASMSLDPNNYSDTDNDNGSFWCEATSSYGAGDLGTPGLANGACGSTSSLIYTNDILPILNAYSCTGCHSNSFSSLNTLLSLQSGDDRSSNAGANMMWVTAGDPTNSYLFHKVSGTASLGGQMPVGGSMSQSDITTIELWITQGAQ